MRELIHTCEREGFTLNTYRLPEITDPADTIATGDDAADAEWCARIASGDLDWFAILVVASRHNIELGSDIIGGCDGDASEFVTRGDYWEDMCAAVIEEARETIRSLCATVEA